MRYLLPPFQFFLLAATNKQVFLDECFFLDEFHFIICFRMWQMVFWNWNVIIDRSCLRNWISNFLALQCSSNWAVKSHMFGSRPMYRVHFYPCQEWDEFEIKLIWNCRIQMKLRCDHRMRSCKSQFKQLEIRKSLRKFSLQLRTTTPAWSWFNFGVFWNV